MQGFRLWFGRSRRRLQVTRAGGASADPGAEWLGGTPNDDDADAYRTKQQALHAPRKACLENATVEDKTLLNAFFGGDMRVRRTTEA